MSPPVPQNPTKSGGAWTVARQELRDLWLGGRGPVLTIGYAVLLSAITYIAASGPPLNVLDHRETVFLAVQVALAVAVLLALLAAADAISGERERGTLESLLLAPVERHELVIGKLAAALSLWVAAALVSLPYLWFLSRGLGIAATLLAGVTLVGLLLATALVCFGGTVSVLARSNRASLSISLFVLLATFAPSQLPSGARTGWLGEALVRVNPVAAGLHYLRGLVIEARPALDEVAWLIAPAVAAVLLPLLAIAISSRFTLLEGGVSE